MPGNLPTGTVTFVLTDIEGSTRTLADIGADRYRDLLVEHRDAMRKTFVGGGGVEVDTQGDAFFFAFARASDAVMAAAQAQQTLKQHALSVRIGIHTGQPLPTGDGYVGVDVHRAARVMAAGHGGQVVVSQATADLVRDDLHDGVALRDLGEHRLKDLSQPQRLFDVVVDGLPNRFPPLQTLGNRPTNLPVQPNRLIGRQLELAEIAKRLRSGQTRLLTLTGPGGTGKTRLALEAAAQLADDFDHGTFAVALASIRDPDLVLPTVAHTLGLREQPGRTADDVLGEYVADRSLLLVLDNFEQVVEAAPLLSQLLARAPQLRLLATSREPLHIAGEAVYTVAPLPAPQSEERLTAEAALRHDSVTLFVERARAATANFELTPDNVHAVTSICARLDGLPLAIELAAARMSVVPAKAVLRRLDNSLDLLTGGPRDADPRQRTLRATVDWSYELLSADEKLLFSRLGAVPGGCRLDAAEAIAQCQPRIRSDVLDCACSLVAKSLLRQREDPDGEPRFWMLETIRDYACERLAERGERAAVEQRHAEWCEALVEEADRQFESSGRSSESVMLLETELPNLRAAGRVLLDSGKTESALRMAAALSLLWGMRGHVAEGRRWIAEALEQGRDAPPQPRARALRVAGILADMQDEHAEAERALRESLELSHQHGTEKDVASVLMTLGVFFDHRAKLDEAQSHYDESRALFEKLGDRRSAASVLMNLGNLAFARGDLGLARTRVEEALSLRRNLGDSHGVAMCLANLGETAIWERNYPQAERLIRESLTLAQDFGDKRLIAHNFANRGRLENLRARPDEAEPYLREAIGLFVELGAREPSAEALEGLAHSALERGFGERAARLLGAAAALRESIASPGYEHQRAFVADVEADVRSRIAARQYQLARNDGRSMSFEEAVAYALDDQAV